MADVKLEHAPLGVRTYYDKGIAALECNIFNYAVKMCKEELRIDPCLLQVLGCGGTY